MNLTPKKTVAKKAAKKVAKKTTKHEPRFITLCSTKSDHTGKTLQFDLNSMNKDQFELVVKSLEEHFEYSNNRINECNDEIRQLNIEILNFVIYHKDKIDKLNTKFTVQNFIIGAIAVFVAISIIMQL